eukprot:8377-Prymnesium_polylepis.2
MHYGEERGRLVGCSKTENNQPTFTGERRLAARDGDADMALWAAARAHHGRAPQHCTWPQSRAPRAVVA